jgi:FAD/FMN-containing dehydrogenase
MCLIEPFLIPSVTICSPYSNRSAGLPEEWTSLNSVEGNSEEEMEAKFKVLRENLERAGGKEKDDPAFMGLLKEMESGTKWREMGALATAGKYTLMEVCSSLGDAPEMFNSLRKLIAKRYEERGMLVRRQEMLMPVGPHNHIASFFVYYDETDPKYREGVLEVFKEFFDVAMSHGWYPDVNQGWANKMIAKYWTPAFSNFMLTMKRALDPNNIMNPGVWGDVI